ncbi:CCA tRNA nucleotidyltransferase [Catenisphaera adipataccumulans]|uniref:tRNA nucleotidyltransferase (CCA-adding enzyme) n=1 Tax=Catenisphaera adipataccumulans TaxID=700500 RepID=A0A7W8FUG8_9FIRM|nr:CCA tRNA nucleotidyltransferase [Catenisphaera adipataccumulans]MBB5182574.1 tRNA nucleotidyltransferase (CCA-adding enzyme) [Catenisphaera adipataccumulans]
MELPQYIRSIIKQLNTAGYQAYVVGGSVRDALLGKKPHDYDVTTDARPEQIINLFDHTAPTGIKHGTVTVLSEQPVEVTTFRTESQYHDHRHPDHVAFVSNLKEDLARRDFTVNAMAYHPQSGLIDPFGGQEDLKKKQIRCVGDPRQRFEEDALRLMRAHRFAAQLDFTIEEETAKAIEECANTICYVSVERIREELFKILRYNAYEIENMTKLLSNWMPELETCKACEQNTPWHNANVLHHILASVTYLNPFDETLALTLLCHDLGKPACKTTVDGIDHFKGHPLVSAQIAKRICRDLKCTRRQQEVIPLLVRYHDVKMKDPLGVVFRFRVQYQWDDERMQQLLEVKRCDLMAHSEFGRRSLRLLDRLKEVYQECLEQRPMTLQELAIDGSDVSRAGFQGKEIRNVLQNCLEYCFYHPDQNNREFLLPYIEQDPWKLSS